ncbi:MAG: HNH endonuclease [Candidatus Sungbacteria bacterium]|uniref:HNH endonuclease n=1 Tax=Candidatus Sungiibacteriota bacterium TaxID=2750080 RepID=A0A931SCD7_9BACT|nr:HNH endonuclease [Candidatus Sungbacteria bacterium]
MIKAVAKRRKKLKEMAIEYKGGKCQICGYKKYSGAFDLHHIDAKEKEFGIAAKGYTRSWKKVKAELDKCILVCANCHREVEAGITSVPKQHII